MISLEKSEKFQQEYQGYQKRIEKIDNIRIKAELEALLEKLILEIRSIDKQHMQLIIKNTLPDITDDHKQKSIDLRRKINKILEDYEKSKIK